MNLTTLICIDKVGHSFDLWIVLVSGYKYHQERYKSCFDFEGLRLGFLTVERIDLAARQHIRKDKVLENLYSLRGPSFVIVLEGVEEVFTCTVPLTLQRYQVRSRQRRDP